MTPLVTIGMPLYNEALYLREALDSLLGQDYRNIEVLMSDNASKDETPAIAREYAAKDPRIRFVRHEENIGAQRNFSDLIPQATGKYFFWAAGHDRWDKKFISKCVALLEADRTLVLAYPQTMRMKADGAQIDVYPSNIDTRGLSASARYRAFLWHVDCNLIYGVWRKEALETSGLFRDVYAPDQLLLSEMAFKGAFAKVREPLWFRRYQRAPETSDEKKNRILEDLKPSEAEKRKQKPLTELYRSLRGHHYTLIASQNLSPLTKASLHLHTTLAFAIRCNIFPGADIIKRLLKMILPSSLKRKIISWLRSG